MISILHFGFLLAIISGCDFDNFQSNPSAHDLTDTLPENIAALDSLVVIPADVQPSDTVELIQVQEFKSNEDVYIRGYPGEVAVDDRDRVYIVASNMGSAGIYVFEPDGSFLTTIGQQGRGPGEFQYIRSLDIWNDKLFVFDGNLQKYAVYSLGDISLQEEEIISQDRVNESDSLARTLKGNDLFLTKNGTKLLRLRSITHPESVVNPQILYYRVGNNGILQPGKFLQQDRYRAFFPEPGTRAGPPRPAPFSRGSLFEVSEHGPIYAAWMDKFLIKVYDQEGNYKKAFYLPYENPALNIPDSWLDSGWDKWMDGNWDQVPDTWPALHTIKVDGQNRLWVSTITESDSTYKWWVLDDQGNVLARFDWPGRRWDRSVLSMQSKITIKEGYFYERDLNFRDEVYRILKYRINFKPHPRSGPEQ